MSKGLYYISRGLKYQFVTQQVKAAIFKLNIHPFTRMIIEWIEYYSYTRSVDMEKAKTQHVKFNFLLPVWFIMLLIQLWIQIVAYMIF